MHCLVFSKTHHVILWGLSVHIGTRLHILSHTMTVIKDKRCLLNTHNIKSIWQCNSASLVVFQLSHYKHILLAVDTKTSLLKKVQKIALIMAKSSCYLWQCNKIIFFNRTKHRQNWLRFFGLLLHFDFFLKPEGAMNSKRTGRLGLYYQHQLMFFRLLFALAGLRITRNMDVEVFNLFTLCSIFSIFFLLNFLPSFFQDYF